MPKFCMSRDELTRTANCAWHDGNVELWQSCMWLLKTLHRMMPASQIIAENSDAQSDLENEADACGITVKELLR